MLDLVFGSSEAGRLIAAPPGIPVERAEALRVASLDAMRDPDLNGEAGKMNPQLEATTADQVHEVFHSLYEVPRPLVSRTMDIMGVATNHC